MTEQEKREKAIEGLGRVRAIGQTMLDCLPDTDSLMMYKLILDTADNVLALLKEREPRVISFKEIDNYEVLWLEIRDVDTEEGIAPWVKTKSGRWFSPLFCSEREPDMILATPEEYGKYCRCWTSRPTDEQREETEWDRGR